MGECPLSDLCDQEHLSVSAEDAEAVNMLDQEFWPENITACPWEKSNLFEHIAFHTPPPPSFQVFCSTQLFACYL